MNLQVNRPISAKQDGKVIQPNAAANSMLTKFHKGTGSFAGLLHHNHSNVNHQQHTNLAFMRKAPSNFKSLGMLNGTQLSNQQMSAAGGKMMMLHPSSNHNILDQRHPS